MKLFIFFSLLFIAGNGLSILDFGAIPFQNDTVSAKHNSDVLKRTFYAANANPNDRIVLVPAEYDFYIFTADVWGLNQITLQIDGNLIVSNSMVDWPHSSQVNYTLCSLYIGDSSNIRVTGKGLYDGQGYQWWLEVIITTYDDRPHLVVFERVQGLVIDTLHVQNAPQYHFLLLDVIDVHIKNIDIYVDVEEQKALLKKGGRYHPELDIPIFPLNTDGIDPAGVNILIENVTIQNFDDAVAVKPCTQMGKYCTCAGNITVRNSQVVYGVGMTIGSVPPNDNVNCIRNVTFENISFQDPFKAIYVKTNPGNSGTGIIDQITYRNIVATGSIWYPIWIGPQQEKQPGTNGTGCSFFYPIIDECPTQPRVKVSNIQLQNVTFTESRLIPGVVLCDVNTPCTGFDFERVTNSGQFLIQSVYVCINANGNSSNNNPDLGCF